MHPETTKDPIKQRKADKLLLKGGFRSARIAVCRVMQISGWRVDSSIPAHNSSWPWTKPRNTPFREMFQPFCCSTTFIHITPSLDMFESPTAVRLLSCHPYAVLQSQECCGQFWPCCIYKHQINNFLYSVFLKKQKAILEINQMFKDHTVAVLFLKL